MLIFVLFGMMAGGYGVWWGWRRLGRMPDSVSELAYVFHQDVFGAWISMVCVLLMPALVDALPDNFGWLAIFVVIGGILVAASSRYRSEFGEVHYAGGVLVVGGMAGAATVLLTPTLLLPAFAIAVAAARRWHGWCFLVETSAYAACVAATLLA
ncbi:MAG: hypothetical protein IKR31_03245 [Prevotella sp.]|nr:hypothetical protein [Prevotella sp.]